MSSYVHPETGEVLASDEDWQRAMRSLEEKLSPIYRQLWDLRREHAERFEPAPIPRRSSRTDTQEKIARCPRCGGRLEDGQDSSTE